MLLSPTKKIILGVLVVLWLVSGKFSSYDKSSNSIEPPKVKIEVIEPTEHQATISVAGIIKPKGSLDLISEAGGKVIFVATDTMAKAGDIIVQLEDQGTERMLRSAEALLEEKTKLYEIDKELTKMGYHAKVSYYAKKSDLESAKANYEKAKINYEKTIIRTPFDGFIGDLLVDPQEVISPMSLVARIFSLANFKVTVFLATQEALRTKIGNDAQILMPDGKLLNGVVASISPTADMDSKLYETKITVPVNDNYPFKMLFSPCRAVIDVEKVRGFKIPASALYISDEGILGIKYVDENSYTVFAPVKIEKALEDSFIVSGEAMPQGPVKIIVRGAGFIESGQKANIWSDA